GLVDTFDAIAISEELGHAKPSAAIFHAAVDMLQLPAACCLYVGNLEAHDARAAQAAGLFGVWLDRTLPGEYAVIGDLPVVSSLRHLPDVVEEFSLSIQLR
ncbi:MAG: HAD family hydrolase, partial [Bdellovibrionales bacterium]|nr:HAD family hydrolase [Bdellovibrionales bacterium]